MAIQVLESIIESETQQADGSWNVVEHHRLSDGRVIRTAYNAAAGSDREAILATRAANIQAQLDAEAALQQQAQVTQPLPLTPAQFMLRFTPAERIDIRTAAKNDPMVEDILALLEGATTGIDVTSQPVIDAVDYLIASNLLSPQRKNEILAQ